MRVRVGEWERGRERDREKKTLGEGGGGRVIRGPLGNIGNQKEKDTQVRNGNEGKRKGKIGDRGWGDVDI